MKRKLWFCLKMDNELLILCFFLGLSLIRGESIHRFVIIVLPFDTARLSSTLR